MRIPAPARAMLVMAAAHACACAQSLLTVAVFNYAAAPHSVLASAAATARLALLSARLDSQWVICENGNCPRSLTGSYLEIYVLPNLQAADADQPRHQPLHHPAGYALAIGFAHPRAYTSYGSAIVAAERTTRPAYLALGCIFLHETGHLLGLAHQPSGAMRASLDELDMDNVAMGRAFNSVERQSLRDAVSVNCRPACTAKPSGP